MGKVVIGCYLFEFSFILLVLLLLFQLDAFQPNKFQFFVFSYELLHTHWVVQVRLVGSCVQFVNLIRVGLVDFNLKVIFVFQKQWFLAGLWLTKWVDFLLNTSSWCVSVQSSCNSSLLVYGFVFFKWLCALDYGQVLLVFVICVEIWVSVISISSWKLPITDLCKVLVFAFGSLLLFHLLVCLVLFSLNCWICMIEDSQIMEERYWCDFSKAAGLFAFAHRSPPWLSWNNILCARVNIG